MSSITADKIAKPAYAVRHNAKQSMFFMKKGDDGFFSKSPDISFFNPGFIQTKLSVSRPEDPYEQEADEVAEKVMQMPEPVTPQNSNNIKEEKLQYKKDDEDHEEIVRLKIKTPFPASINKKEDDGKKEDIEKSDLMVNSKGELVSQSLKDLKKEERIQNKFTSSLQRREKEFAYRVSEEDEMEVQRMISGTYKSNAVSEYIQRTGRGPPTSPLSIEQQLLSSKGNGNPMPENTRVFMEERFRSDFSGVRIHTGSDAQHLSSAMHAQAFTHGSDIYFNSGKYNTNSAEGNLLLAHELTHTIQQGSIISKKTVTNHSSPNLISQKGTVNSVNTHKIQLKLSTENIPSGIDLSNKSSGYTIPSEAREYLQNYYKTNLNDIRIHTDNKAAGICKSLGVYAFTQGKDIFIWPAKYDPDSERGAILLSEQVSISLNQRGIKSTGTDGNDISSPSSLINMITTAIKEITQGNASVSKVKAVSKPSGPLKEKGKKEASKKEIKGDKEKKKVVKEKKKYKHKDTGGPVFKAVKLAPNKSPSHPGEDPAFLRVIKKTKATANKEKQHEPAEKKSSDAQKSAKAVPNEAESKAQNRKTDGMGEAAKKDIPFDAASFKADLLKKIEAITPKTLEEADDFKKENKISDVKNAMGEKVAGEKENTTGPVDKAEKQPLRVNDADNKKSVPLPPTDKGAKPLGIGAHNAVPKNKLDNEISMQEQSQSLDEALKRNNVTEEQLARSNESSFNEALNEKRKAQQDAAEKPKQYRQEEKLILKEAKTTAQEESAKSLVGMYRARGKNFEITVKHQQTAKQKDEERRATVAKEIESKYLAAEEKVKKALEEADSQSNKFFDEGSETARREFENYVDEKMRAYKHRRYSGFWGGLKWAKDKLFGMPDEVNEFYKDGRRLYLNKMDVVITQVADIVTTKLNEAKQAITAGKKEIDEYVNKLPNDLQDIGKEAAENIQAKFDALEQSVDDKRNDLIDGLAKKYVDNVKKLDDRINELKEANKGLVDKAIGYLKKVWQIIKDLTNLFTTILARLASIIGIILSSPSGFFDNLGKAFTLGFNNFKDKFLDYLEKGLMEWLTTNLGIAGIELPEKFSAASIFSLVLQVMGITKQHIRERAVKIIGERKVKLLESGGGILYRIYNEGLGALWDMIREKLTDLKEIVWEAIKSFIKTKIIEAAIAFLLSLLSPIGAFIKVCMAIYDFLMMLVRFKDRILELLDTILNAVIDIASGAIGGAAKAIEGALAKSISVIIGFLAALLHLNDVVVKVRNIITRIRARVDKAIDWVLKKAAKVMEKLIGKTREIIGGGGSAQKRLQNGLWEGQRAVNKFAGRRVGARILAPLLSVIKLKYGLQSLEVVPRGNVWAVRGRVNPIGEINTDAQVDTAIGKTSKEQDILESLITKESPVYSVDSLGRASGSHGYVEGVKDNEEREDIPSILPKGYLPGDQRGHLIGDRFYGSNLNNNIVPMHRTLNLSTFKSFENSLAKAYKQLKTNGKGVALYMNIIPDYPGVNPNINANYRPTQITANCKIVKLKEGNVPPHIEEQVFNPSPFNNPLPVISAININTASDESLIDVFGSELGRIIFRIRKVKFKNIKDLQYKVALAVPETQIARHNENIITKSHLINF